MIANISPERGEEVTDGPLGGFDVYARPAAGSNEPVLVEGGNRR